jgi:hypothetical protein
MIIHPRDPATGTKAALHNSQNGYALVEVKFPQDHLLSNRPVIETLNELANLVAGIIDKLERHCHRPIGVFSRSARSLEAGDRQALPLSLLPHLARRWNEGTSTTSG